MDGFIAAYGSFLKILGNIFIWSAGYCNLLKDCNLEDKISIQFLTASNNKNIFDKNSLLLYISISPIKTKLQMVFIYQLILYAKIEESLQSAFTLNYYKVMNIYTCIQERGNARNIRKNLLNNLFIFFPL